MARKAATESDHDPSRREFFKTFSRQTLENVGTVAGAAAEFRRTGLAAARELLDMTEVPTPRLAVAPGTPTIRVVAQPTAPASVPSDTFRSAYRYTGTALVVLDQRALPDRVVTFECHSAADVASALRSGAVSVGPVMGQVAAYGIALVATSVVAREERSRDQAIRAATDAIRASRGDVHAVAAAVDRMVSCYDELANAGAGNAVIAERLAAAADLIATEATAACAEIGRSWAQLIVGDSVDFLVHGNSGPLSCGMVGMVTTGIKALIDAGRHVHVWVTEGSPSGEGARITALELTQLDIPHTVIPDSAMGWLIAARRITAVVLRGDTIAANGDIVTLLGARAVAQIAHDADVPVHVLAPESSWDHRAPDTSALVLDLRSAAELGSADRARLNPPFDVVPARNVTSYVGEAVVVSPPFKVAN